MSELRKKANELAVLAFGTELIAERYEKRVTHARRLQKPTIAMSVDELESLCKRLRELTAPVRDWRDLLNTLGNTTNEAQALKFPAADPATASPTGDTAA
jgi:hypothetical protein